MAKGKTTYLYPSEEANVSNFYTLIEDFGVITIDGWGEGDCACLETWVGGDCDGRWVPFSPDCCGQKCYGYPVNRIYLAIPGKYRLVFSNIDDNHLTDPSWFENMEVIGEKVSSNIDLSVFLKGVENMACGPKVSLTQDVNGCLTISVDDVAYTICPGSQVNCANGTGIVIDGELCEFPEETVTTLTDNNDGTFTFVNEAGQSVTIDAGETTTSLTDNGNGSFTYVDEEGNATTVSYPVVSCASGGILIDGTLCEFPPEVEFVDNGDCTGTLTVDGTEFTVITEKPVIPDATSMVSSDATIEISQTGQAFDIGVEPLAVLAEISNDPSAVAILCDIITNQCGLTADINVDNFTYNPATQDITITESNGDTHTVNVSDLVDTDTNTTNTGLGFNSTSNVLTLTDSDGNSVTVDLSALAASGPSGLTSVATQEPVTGDGTSGNPVGLNLSTDSTLDGAGTSADPLSIAGADAATSGQVPTSDGAGGVTWTTPASGGTGGAANANPFTAGQTPDDWILRIGSGTQTYTFPNGPTSDGYWELVNATHDESAISEAPDTNNGATKAIQQSGAAGQEPIAIGLVAKPGSVWFISDNGGTAGSIYYWRDTSGAGGSSSGSSGFPDGGAPYYVGSLERGHERSGAGSPVGSSWGDTFPHTVQRDGVVVLTTHSQHVENVGGGSPTLITADAKATVAVSVGDVLDANYTSINNGMEITVNGTAAVRTRSSSGGGTQEENQLVSHPGQLLLVGGTPDPVILDVPPQNGSNGAWAQFIHYVPA